jgi:hypothetical protein
LPCLHCCPCRDDDAETPDRSHKPIPEWARSQVLYEALKAQQATDPDSIFGARQTTCDLGDMFAGGRLGLWPYPDTLGLKVCNCSAVHTHVLFAQLLLARPCCVLHINSGEKLLLLLPLLLPQMCLVLARSRSSATRCASWASAPAALTGARTG